MEHHHHHHDYHDDHPDDDKNKVRGVGTGSGRERGEGEILIEVVRKRRNEQQQRSRGAQAKERRFSAALFGGAFCAVSLSRFFVVVSLPPLARSLSIAISRGCDVAIEVTPEIERRSID